ncbi:MAG: type VI secretion system baseplate subunit TssK [Longimicrobiales bacterium]
MQLLSRVVWSEGMHLAQHHFQTQNRYFEEYAAFVFSSLFYRGYGFAGVEFDADALSNGTVALTHARGVMPDGTPFHFPDEEAPRPLPIRELFSPTQDTHRVLLALPLYRADQANCQIDSSTGMRDPRYAASTQVVPDETTGQTPRSVAVARKNFRLLLDVQPAADLVMLPAARIRRDGSGRFVYDADYIPPSTQIGASRRLMELLSRLIEVLEAKAVTMAEERRRTGNLAEYAAREVAGFWLTHAVHSALGPLRHFWQTRSVHPEQLYAELARLAGALCTFSLDADPRKLPSYDHDEPESCFAQLERHILRQLEVMLPSNCLKVPIEAAEPGFYHGSISDRRAITRGKWFLGVRSSAGQGALIKDVPRLVKLCSAEHIVKLVQRAYPGLVLEHVPVPPSEISPRIGMQYFSVQTNPTANSPGEPCWKFIAETTHVGIYVPAAIPDAELDLSIVLES